MDVFGWGFNGFSQLQPGLQHKLRPSQSDCTTNSASQPSVSGQRPSQIIVLPQTLNIDLLPVSRVDNTIGLEADLEDILDVEPSSRVQVTGTQCKDTQTCQKQGPAIKQTDNCSAKCVNCVVAGWDRICFCLDTEGENTLIQHGPHLMDSTHSDINTTTPSGLTREGVRDVCLSWQNTFIVNNEGQCLVSDSFKEHPDFQPVKILPTREDQPDKECNGVIRGVEAGGKHIVALFDSGHIGMIEHDPDRDVFLCRPLSLHMKIKAISCGKEHVMLLTRIGVVLTFGVGGQGQLGHGDAENKDNPHIVEALQGVSIASIAAGGWHSVALSDIGDVYTWGWNERGQLGHPSKVVREQQQQAKKNQPVKLKKNKNTPHTGAPLLPSLPPYAAGAKKDAAELQSPGPDCSRSTEGDVELPNQGQDCSRSSEGKVEPLNQGQDCSRSSEGKVEPPNQGQDCSTSTEGDVELPNQGQDCSRSTEGEVEQPNLGQDYSKSTKGEVEQTNQGQDYSKSTEGDVDELVNIQPLPGVLDMVEDGEAVDLVSVSAGSRHTAAISEQGTLFTWGWNDHGQLGHGDTVSRDKPLPVEYFKQEKLTVSQVFCGWWNTVVVTEKTDN